MSDPRRSTPPIYLDSSALLKLVFDEPETEALEHFLHDKPQRTCSVIGRVEVMRVARRADDDIVERHAQRVIGGLTSIGLDEALLMSACELQPRGLRSLDAIHLASALSLMPHIAGLVVYDSVLAKAARAAGLQVWAPA